MKKSALRSVLLLLVPAAVTFFIAPLIWKMDPGIQPTSAQLGWFIALTVIESLAFGLGVWFLVEGKPLLANAMVSKRLTAWAYLSIAWSLLSWWAHDNFHKANGEDLQGLLYIEYAFHFTLIFGGLITARYFLATLRSRASAQQ